MTQVATGASGEKIFIENCLNCHIQNGLATQFNFSSPARVAEIKNQLINKIENKEMPPLQFSRDNKYPRLDGGTSFLSDIDRKKLVSWIKSLDSKSRFSPTGQAQLKVTSKLIFKKDSSLDYSKFDYILKFTSADLKPFYISQSSTDNTVFYKLNLETANKIISDYSYVGYEIRGNSYIHHLELSYQANNFVDSLMLWTPFHPAKYVLPDDLRLTYRPVKDLYFLKHNYYGDKNSAASNAEEISVFFSKKKSNLETLNIAFRSPYLTIAQNEQLSQNLPIHFNFKVKMMFPHMHKSGQQLTLKIFRPVLKDEVYIANFFGWIQDVQIRYKALEEVLLKDGDTLNITCTYNKSLSNLNIGWGAEDEMCLAALYVEKII